MDLAIDSLICNSLGIVYNSELPANFKEICSDEVNFKY